MATRANRDLIVIGASAGGVEALRRLVSLLPADLPATVLVVLHIAPTAHSALPGILARSGKLAVHHGEDGAAIERRTVLVAPPDHHMRVHGERIRIDHGARENGHRPAVDPLFRSAARWYGPRVIGVILSGALDDGASGMLAVKLAGGVVIAQDPEEAAYPSMPLSVINGVHADHVAPVAQIAQILERLVHESIEIQTPPHPPPMTEKYLEDEDMAAAPSMAPAGAASSFTCPECHGALWELNDGELTRYRCRVGHAFAPDSLMAYQAGHVEEAMWTAFRALEETAALAERLAARARSSGLEDLAERYDEQRLDANRRAALIRGVLELSTAPAAPKRR